MKDTPPAIERKFHQMLLKRSGAERLKMGCSMHATARALAKAHLSQEHPGSDPAELRRLLFLHFYRADFSRAEGNRIASALSESGPRSNATKASPRSIRDSRITNACASRGTCGSVPDRTLAQQKEMNGKAAAWVEDKTWHASQETHFLKNASLKMTLRVVFGLQNDQHLDTPIDVFVSEPFDFDREYDLALVGDIMRGVQARFVCLETLIRMKESTMREKDREDVRQLKLLLENSDE